MSFVVVVLSCFHLLLFWACCFVVLLFGFVYSFGVNCYLLWICLLVVVCVAGFCWFVLLVL